MTFCTITPTRGDRPELLDFCKHQLSRMSLKPDQSYFIDYKPEGEAVDLVERVRKGVEKAQADGFDRVFIIEDDDHYPANYFSQFDMDSYTFWGAENTVYYNLRSRSFTEFHHPGRSSLFVTGFSISALTGFGWHAPRNRFLDIVLWEHADNMALPRQIQSTCNAIGIKHNLGLCAGKGHTMRGKNTDEGLEWLRKSVDSEAFDFYSDLITKL